MGSGTPDWEDIPFEPSDYLLGRSDVSDSSSMKYDPNARGVFNPTTPMIIDDRPTTTTAAVFREFDGITGDVADIHQTLQACLQVGRLERAAALMRRLNALYKPDAPGLIDAHNQYLCKLNDEASRTHSSELLVHTQRWFEVNLRANRVPPNATTFALMVQSSRQESDPDKVKDRTRRYLRLAEEAGRLEETRRTIVKLLHEEELELLDEVGTSLLYFGML